MSPSLYDTHDRPHDVTVSNDDQGRVIHRCTACGYESRFPPRTPCRGYLSALCQVGIHPRRIDGSCLDCGQGESR